MPVMQKGFAEYDGPFVGAKVTKEMADELEAAAPTIRGQRSRFVRAAIAEKLARERAEQDQGAA